MAAAAAAGCPALPGTIKTMGTAPDLGLQAQPAKGRQGCDRVSDLGIRGCNEDEAASNGKPWSIPAAASRRASSLGDGSDSQQKLSGHQVRWN